MFSCKTGKNIFLSKQNWMITIKNDRNLTDKSELVGRINDQHLLQLGHFVPLFEVRLWCGKRYLLVERLKFLKSELNLLQNTWKRWNVTLRFNCLLNCLEFKMFWVNLQQNKRMIVQKKFVTRHEYGNSFFGPKCFPPIFIDAMVSVNQSQVSSKAAKLWQGQLERKEQN